MAVAAAERGSQPVPVRVVEGLQPAPASLRGGCGVHQLHAVQAPALDQPRQHRRLAGGEVGGHERVRDHREPSLLLDGRDRVLQALASRHGPLQEPAQHVGLSRPASRHLLPLHHRQPRFGAALEDLLGAGHGVVPQKACAGCNIECYC